MRVSTQAFFKNSIATLQRLQSDLNGIQEQVATGRRIQRPSQDPVGSARALDLRQSLASLDQYQRNTGLVQNRLQLQEQTLTDVTSLLQRARELSLQASNGTQTNESRGFIATELRQSVDALLSLANTRDASESYLFSGFQTATRPFTRVAGGYQYNGDQGQRFVQVSNSRQLADSDPGDQIFSLLREGNGQVLASADAANTGTGVIYSDTVSDIAGYNYERYSIAFTAEDSYDVLDGAGAVLASGAFSPGDSIAVAGFSFRIDGAPSTGDQFDIEPSPNTDIFSVIDRISTALESGDGNDAQRAETDNALARGIQGLDQALGTVLTARTRIGSRLNVADSQLDANSGTQILLQSSLSGIEDLDYAEAISALTQQASALEAAQQSFVRVQSLSLFNFL